MKATIKFVSEVTFDETCFVKVRFEDSFPGFKQNQDGEFTEENVNEVIMYKSKFLAQVFDELPELALAYARTESFTCVAAALQRAACELKRQLVRDEDSSHDRYETLITDIVVREAVKVILDKELERAFE